MCLPLICLLIKIFLFKIVLFLINYQECRVTNYYFVFIEFVYYMKLFVWRMIKTSWLVGMRFGGVTYFLVLSICTGMTFQQNFISLT